MLNFKEEETENEKIILKIKKCWKLFTNKFAQRLDCNALSLGKKTCKCNGLSLLFSFFYICIDNNGLKMTKAQYHLGFL
jgi:hypothetical protein